MGNHKFGLGDTVIVKIPTFDGVDGEGGAKSVHREGKITKLMDYPTRYEVTFPDGRRTDLREGQLASLGEE